VIPLQVVVIALVAAAGLAVVLTRDLVRLAMMASVFGVLLVVLFLVLQAPDVALSELVVGAVGLPLVIAVAIAIDRSE
jgi:energy-converting hydrogenase B subunit D